MQQLFAVSSILQARYTIGFLLQACILRLQLATQDEQGEQATAAEKPTKLTYSQAAHLGN